MDELGVDIEKMLANKEFGYGRNGEKGAAIWFDADTYGQDRLLTGSSLNEKDPDRMVEIINQIPVSETAREQLRQFYTRRTNVFEGISEDQVMAYLTSTSYTDFLRQHGGLGDEAIQSSTTRRAGGMMKAPRGGYCQSPDNIICS